MKSTSVVSIHRPFKLAAPPTPPVHREWLTVLLSCVPGARTVPDVLTAVPGKAGAVVGVVLAEKPGGGGGRLEPVLLAVVDTATVSSKRVDNGNYSHHDNY